MRREVEVSRSNKIAARLVAQEWALSRMRALVIRYMAAHSCGLQP